MTLPSRASSAIGFVGLGHMGGPMAARVVAGGFDVVGFDRVPAAVETAASAGVHIVDSLEELTRSCEIVVLSLPSSDIVDAVVAEILAVEGSRVVIVVDTSSSEPMRTQLLADRAEERGIALVDAPVSGGVPRAKTGELTIMVGGSEKNVDTVRQVLETMGTPIHVGAVGAGHAVKALNNYLNATHLLASAEAATVAVKFGIRADTFIDVVNASSGRSGSTELKFPRYILTGAFNSGFSADLLEKDLRIAAALEATVGVVKPLAAEVLERWAALNLRLDTSADHTAIITPMESDLGVRVRGTT